MPKTRTKACKICRKACKSPYECDKCQHEKVLSKTKRGLRSINEVFKGIRGPRGYPGIDCELLLATGSNALCTNGGLQVDPVTPNTSIIVGPTGTGFLSADTPLPIESGGGNCRGENAIDFQMIRTRDSSVASGDRSFLGGGYNNTIRTGANQSVIIGGIENIISLNNENSFIGNGFNNYIGNGNNNFIGNGYTNAINLTENSAIIGGNVNEIGGTGANAIIGGFDGEINGSYNSTIMNGNNLVRIRGNYSFVSGGRTNRYLRLYADYSLQLHQTSTPNRSHESINLSNRGYWHYANGRSNINVGGNFTNLGWSASPYETSYNWQSGMQGSGAYLEANYADVKYNFNSSFQNGIDSSQFSTIINGGCCSYFVESNYSTQITGESVRSNGRPDTFVQTDHSMQCSMYDASNNHIYSYSSNHVVIGCGSSAIFSNTNLMMVGTSQGQRESDFYHSNSCGIISGGFENACYRTDHVFMVGTREGYAYESSKNSFIGNGYSWNTYDWYNSSSTLIGGYNVNYHNYSTIVGTQNYARSFFKDHIVIMGNNVPTPPPALPTGSNERAFIITNSSTNKMSIDTDGNMFLEGAMITNTTADYAEFFESLSGQQIDPGTSVIIENGKIREAKEGESPIGVISKNSTVIGNAFDDYWHGKYFRKENGELTMEISKEFDSLKEYIPRRHRREWNIVGLLGQIPINKGQIVDSKWVKIKDLNNQVELWLVK